jgi:hypothetical protein
MGGATPLPPTMKYKQKYRTAINIAFGASLIAVSSIWLTITFYKTAQKNRDYALSLEQSQYVMVWQMDKSASDQIENRGECVIKLLKPSEK